MNIDIDNFLRFDYIFYKTIGIDVEGLSKHLVDTYDAIEQKM
jgi:hypothetical protein